jgi:peptidoglycan-associated lipoprotein
MKTFGLLLLAAAIFITGCPAKTVQVTEPTTTVVTEGPRQEVPQVSRDTNRIDRRGGISEEEIAAAERTARERALQESMKSAPFSDILFDFDSYSIQAQYTPKLKDIRDWLARNNNVAIIIEGHCDERGTAEYNLALGQKRAEAVKEYLVKGGIAEIRIKTISYGKEAPSDPGHAEDAWAKNRRAHFTVERKG